MSFAVVAKIVKCLLVSACRCPCGARALAYTLSCTVLTQASEFVKQLLKQKKPHTKKLGKQVASAVTEKTDKLFKFAKFGA